MATAHVWDIDEEGLLRHFCLEEEAKEVLNRFKEEGYVRPEDFDGRLRLATSLKEHSNKCIKEEHFSDAMLHALFSLHSIDFSKARESIQSEKQKVKLLELLVPLLSNLSFIFLKRNDSHNSIRAANLSLERSTKLPDGGDPALCAKLHFRRGLAHGLAADFEDALKELKKAARLKPADAEIRRAIKNCKIALERQKDSKDEPWRGLLTDEKEGVLKATLRRWLRPWRRRAKKALASAFNSETFLFVSFTVVGVLIGCVVPLLAQYMGYTRSYRFKAGTTIEQKSEKVFKQGEQINPEDFGIKPEDLGFTQ
eukprot:TRINITY_DN52801_c0_g1_i1.p1 TRINITY_DN52801_c0_g1~~TRINITY_DN52801_c0_g1_i1.p1  ORF type:complete len:311 (-),score=60.06 TRINITY_DN52801_c0_g1_i1:56-988(-)